MGEVQIIIKSYPKEAERLIEIWESHCKPVNKGLSFITFINKMPKNPRTDNRRILGLPAKAISYLGDNEELIKMSVENFIYLMVKCGVDIEVEKIK